MPQGLRHVRLLQGEITRENFERVAEVIVDECDAVLGINARIEVSVEQCEDQSGLVASSPESDRLVLYRTPDTDVEFVINGGVRWEHGGWIIDGFYLIKPGGLHQGIASFGLFSIDEATVMLNPAVRIVGVALSEMNQGT